VKLSPPLARALGVYESEPCARSFEEDLWHHLMHGYVVSTPEAFAMVRIVWRHWPLDVLRQPWHADEQGDAWLIWLLAGDMSVAARWLPVPKPWIGFERKNKMRFYRSSRFLPFRAV
jgi:hypothetical protein